MSLNNNKIELNLVIDNNRILFILEPKEIKLDNIVINKINEYIDILRKEIKQQKVDNEKNIRELKNEIENIKKELNNKSKVNEEINNILNYELNHNQIIKDIKKENNRIKEKMEDVEYQINNIKQNLPGKMPIGNSNMMNNNPMNNTNYMNMNIPINNMMNMPINNMNMMNNIGVGIFNIMNPNINNGFTNYKPNLSSIKGIFPRNTGTSIYDVVGGNIISITLTASTGSKTIMIMDASTTIEDMLKEYGKKIDLPVDEFGKAIMFLFNGALLDFRSKRTIGSMFRNTAVINVYDYEDIIGLWTINFDASTNVKIPMKINQNKTIKNMMETYANKIRLPKEVIGKDIVFLYNGENLKAKQNDSVERVLSNKATIIVYDVGNVLINAKWI